MDPRIFAGAPSGLKNSFGLNVLSNIPLFTNIFLSLKEINPKPRVTAGVSTIKKKGPLSAVHRFYCASKQISCNQFEVTFHHIKSLQFGVLLKKVLTHYSKKNVTFFI